VSVFRKEVVRRFNIIDIQKVKETELTEQRTYRAVEVDPHKLVRLFSDVLYQPELAGQPPEVFAVQSAPPLGVSELAHAVPDVNVAARGLSADVLASAAEVAKTAGEFTIPSQKPKPLKHGEPAIRFDTTFAASIGENPAPPGPVDAPESPILVQPLSPSLAQPLASIERPPAISRPAFDLERQPLLPEDNQPVARLQGKPADLAAAIASARPPDGEGCIFRLMVTGRDSRELKPLAKDVVFAIDVSATMPEEKIAQARLAAQAYLPTLAAKDRFNLVLLGEKLYPVFQAFVPATPENIDKAVKLIQERPSESSADICRAIAAICTAVPASDRPCNVFLVTNAAANRGPDHARHAVTDLAAALKPNISLFTFDSGADSNRYLLDLIAHSGRGQFAYSANTPGSSAALVNLARQHDKPLLTSVAVSYANLDPNETFPARLPCLYVDQPLVIYGRSRPGAELALQLTGMGEGGRRTWFEHVTVPPPDPRNKYVQQGWARRKIHFLVASVAGGADGNVVEQIRQLGAQCAVPTPYAD